jgi:ataxia telangiectasia mutated family protein
MCIPYNLLGNVLIQAVLISSTKVADRNTGLKDLIHILQHNRGKPTLEILGNKAYLALCETLLQCMSDERRTFLKSKARTSKTAPLLPLAAKALRHVIHAGVRTIKSSTVELIVDSITQSLPDKSGSLLSPLVEDLPKTLRALLEYQPHVERLSKQCCDATVEFCVESLASIFAEPEAEESASWSTAVSSLGRTPFESTDGGPRPSPRTPSSMKPSIANELIHAAEDLVYCLQLLVKASNSPVLVKAEPILKALIGYLQQKSARGKSAALAAVNSILPRITLHTSLLTQQIVQELLPLMKAMWSDLLLRDEILITLTHTEAHIASLLASSPDESFSLELEVFVDALYSDYRRRQESTANQYLEDDHLCFRRIGPAADDSHPLNTCAFSMESQYSRYEGLWVTVATIARFSFLLDERKHRVAQDREDADESMVKRLRVTHHFQEYVRHISETRSNAKRAALQVIAFMVQEGPLDGEELQSLLERLVPCISDENPAHSSWAMLALAA